MGAVARNAPITNVRPTPAWNEDPSGSTDQQVALWAIASWLSLPEQRRGGGTGGLCVCVEGLLL